MRAVLSRDTGGPESLVVADVDPPAPKPGEVVVAVRACGVNYPDVLMLRDAYQFKPPRPFSPGGEIAGVIEALGEGVEGLRIGDRVLAGSLWGGMAEQVACPAARCIPMPPAMPYDEGAAFLTTYGTAYHGLVQRAGIRPGETLLVLGAGGGVGLAAVELGRALGARVVAAASSDRKVALARTHGAEDGLVYPAAPGDLDGRAMAAAFKTALGESGADIVFDVAGGGYAEPALRATAWEGRFLVVGFAAGIPRIPLNLALLKGCAVLGVFYGAWSERNPQGRRANVEALLALYEAGRIRPHISERFDLADAGAAIARLEQRQATGKVVVTIDGPGG